MIEVPAKAELLIPRSLGRTILKIDGHAAQDTNNCAVECFCNIAAATPEHEALAAVLVSIWKPLFFNELRTQQQLGYVVSCFMRIRVTHVSLIFVVQTDRLPEIALKSIDKFFGHAFTHIICTVTERQTCPELSKSCVVMRPCLKLRASDRSKVPRAVRRHRSAVGGVSSQPVGCDEPRLASH